MTKPLPYLLAWAASCLLGLSLNLQAQTAPVITTQPASQVALPGATVSFGVVPGGPGPLTYQWQFNGTKVTDNVILNVAGTGYPGYASDGVLATNTWLYHPEGVALDALGNLYVADTANNRVRKVDTNGIITTVAGKGTAGFSGDGTAATSALINAPAGLIVDLAGNLYIADTENDRIRKVATNGIISTFAGTNALGFSGDGGAATNARLFSPVGMALDAAGDLYFADRGNGRIRRVAPNGIITTVAGTNTSVLGDGGPATAAGLSHLDAVVIGPDGSLYVADQGHQRVRKVSPGGVISTVAGDGSDTFAGDGGSAILAALNYPSGVALDKSGNLYISDQTNYRIRRVNTNGIITTAVGKPPSGYLYSGDGGLATNAALYVPAGIAVDAAGNLYIADEDNNRVRKVLFHDGYAILPLGAVSAANTGTYSVVTSNAYGSITSSVASLQIASPFTPPQIAASGTNFGFQTNHFGFTLNGIQGQTIVVDGSVNLMNWTPLSTNTANGSPLYFADPIATNYPWRFYRARLQ